MAKKASATDSKSSSSVPEQPGNESLVTMNSRQESAPQEATKDPHRHPFTSSLEVTSQESSSTAASSLSHVREKPKRSSSHEPTVETPAGSESASSLFAPTESTSTSSPTARPRGLLRKGRYGNQGAVTVKPRSTASTQQTKRKNLPQTKNKTETSLPSPSSTDQPPSQQSTVPSSPHKKKLIDYSIEKAALRGGRMSGRKQHSRSKYEDLRDSGRQMRRNSTNARLAKEPNTDESDEAPLIRSVFTTSEDTISELKQRAELENQPDNSTPLITFQLKRPLKYLTASSSSASYPIRSIPQSNSAVSSGHKTGSQPAKRSTSNTKTFAVVVDEQTGKRSVHETKARRTPSKLQEARKLALLKRNMSGATNSTNSSQGGAVFAQMASAVKDLNSDDDDGDENGKDDLARQVAHQLAKQQLRKSKRSKRRASDSSNDSHSSSSSSSSSNSGSSSSSSSSDSDASSSSFYSSSSASSVSVSFDVTPYAKRIQPTILSKPKEEFPDHSESSSSFLNEDDYYRDHSEVDELNIDYGYEPMEATRDQVPTSKAAKSLLRKDSIDSVDDDDDVEVFGSLLEALAAPKKKPNKPVQRAAVASDAGKSKKKHYKTESPKTRDKSDDSKSSTGLKVNKVKGRDSGKSGSKRSDKKSSKKIYGAKGELKKSSSNRSLNLKSLEKDGKKSKSNSSSNSSSSSLRLNGKKSKSSLNNSTGSLRLDGNKLKSGSSHSSSSMKKSKKSKKKGSKKESESSEQTSVEHGNRSDQKQRISDYKKRDKLAPSPSKSQSTDEGSARVVSKSGLKNSTSKKKDRKASKSTDHETGENDSHAAKGENPTVGYSSSPRAREKVGLFGSGKGQISPSKPKSILRGSSLAAKSIESETLPNGPPKSRSLSRSKSEDTDGLTNIERRRNAVNTNSCAYDEVKSPQSRSIGRSKSSDDDTLRGSGGFRIAAKLKRSERKTTHPLSPSSWGKLMTKTKMKKENKALDLEDAELATRRNKWSFSLGRKSPQTCPASLKESVSIDKAKMSLKTLDLTEDDDDGPSSPKISKKQNRSVKSSDTSSHSPPPSPGRRGKPQRKAGEIPQVEVLVDIAALKETTSISPKVEDDECFDRRRASMLSTGSDWVWENNGNGKAKNASHEVITPTTVSSTENE